jgi:predicted DNA-binding protein
MDMHQLLSTLTLENATEWTNSSEAVTWIEYTFLDPNDLPRSNSNIARIEDRFESLLRQDIERQILEKLVDDALAVGCLVSVHDGEDQVVSKCQDRETILSATRSTDADSLAFRTADGKIMGSVLLIYGNGYDLISDCSDTASLRALLVGAEALAESFQG